MTMNIYWENYHNLLWLLLYVTVIILNLTVANKLDFFP